MILSLPISALAKMTKSWGSQAPRRAVCGIRGSLRTMSCDPQKSPDTPGSPEGNTEGPGTTTSGPLLPS